MQPTRTIRKLLAMEGTVAKKPLAGGNLSDEDRRKLIEKAQKNLVSLDQTFNKAISDLERISSGHRRY